MTINRRDILKSGAAAVAAGQLGLATGLADGIAAPATTAWFEEAYRATFKAFAKYQHWCEVHDRRRAWVESRAAARGDARRSTYFPVEQLSAGLEALAALSRLSSAPPRTLADSDLQRRALDILSNNGADDNEDITRYRRRVEVHRNRLLSRLA